MSRSYQAIICGAGIAGVGAAYFLGKAGLRDILLVDERAPLSLTSDRSTECYRNWWPDPDMLALMNRSIDLMEELAEQSGNVFHLNRRGYLYLTADESKIPAMLERAQRISSMGAGDLRIHQTGESCYEPPAPSGFLDEPTGADLLMDPGLIVQHFPYVTPKAVAGLHARRAGWLSAQQLGMYLFEQGRASGVTFASDRVEGLDTAGGRVRAVRLATGTQHGTSIFVNAAGPYLARIEGLAGAVLPIHTELHLKVVIGDALGVLGREAPLLIWDDAQHLPWQSEERRALAEDPETHWLTEPFPAGAHTRPEGGDGSSNIILLWEYRTHQMEPRWPAPLDDLYPEIALRGMSTMLPGLKAYFGRMPRPQMDGGYYTKTDENRPLIGPAGPEGSYVIGALSGYGIMAACGAADLLAAHITGHSLPAYAPTFVLDRYENPAYVEGLKSLTSSGQL